MDNIFFTRRRAERFAQLLDEANGGRRHHVRSRNDDELATLVAIGKQIQATKTAVVVEPEFRAGLRAMLVATAERDRIAAPETGGSRAAGATASRPLLPPATARRARARGAILVGVAAGAVAVSGISAASENAVPGDALYGMKRSTERAQLALTGSDLSRGQLFLAFARTRLAEAGSLRGDRVAFTAVLDDMDGDTRHGVRLLVTAGHRAEGAGLEAVDSFLRDQRQALTGLLDGASRAERDRTHRSLAVLDAARKRSDALRAALACGVTGISGSDSLGPIPHPCPTDR